jgi:hypothetical protein
VEYLPIEEVTITTVHHPNNCVQVDVANASLGLGVLRGFERSHSKRSLVLIIQGIKKGDVTLLPTSHMRWVSALRKIDD